MEDNSQTAEFNTEKSLIGAILVGQDALPKAIVVLSGMLERCFFHPPHQYIFNAIVELGKNRVPLDAITLCNKLESQKTLEESGGLAYITELINVVPTSSNVEHYARSVQETTRKRDIYDLMTQALAQHRSVSADDYSSFLRRGLIACEPHERKGMTRIENIVPEVMEDLESYVDPEFERSDVRTGINALDDILISLGREEFIVIAARTSVGKSAVALNIAVNVSRGQGIPVLFFSLEMSTQACLERVLSMVGEVDIHAYRRGAGSNSLLSDIGVASKKIDGMNLWLNDTDRMDLDEMISVIRLHIETEGKPGLIVIDYLQLISLGGSYKSIDIRQRIVIVTGALKAMAKEFKCPVICLSQLNREAGDDPKLTHLAESASIENDADKVILVSRASGDKKSMDNRNKLKFDVAKNRNGPVGYCLALFVMSHQLIRDLNYNRPKEPEPVEEVGDVQEDLY